MDPLQGLFSDSDSNDSSSEEKSNIHDKIQNYLNKPTTSRNSIHVSVHRSGISSTTVQEGQNEIDNLGVEVYDQQTYEEGVFEQVNRALSDADSQQQSRQQKDNNDTNSNICDLLRLIHDEPNNNNESRKSGSRDYDVLQLTRRERLNRTVKIENLKQEKAQTNNLPPIPKIPRIQKAKSNSIPPQPKRQSNSRLSETTSQSTENGGLLQSPLKRLKTSYGISLEVFEDEGANFDRDDEIDDGSNVGDNLDHNDVASEYVPSEEEETESVSESNSDASYHTDKDLGEDLPKERKKPAKSKRKRNDLRDDGDFQVYEARIKAYRKERARMRLANITEDGVESKSIDEMVQIDGDLQIPKNMWDALFEHQRTGVRWLWELHLLGTGGILGDEMGLGKTIQTIAFLTALRTSNIANAHEKFENLGPTILVCPATVMQQWLMEFRKWYPPFRVGILHSTGTFSGDRKQLVKVIHKSRGILIVSYPGVVIYQDYLHGLDWHYAILDEGHKIRNPDAQVTLACKRFRTPHRIILSGSPVQNNLKELWSIFDFIYPGKLGTLPVFMGQFAIPITQGGYANASDIQVQIAYKCACVLRDTIKPFLLRRTKAEVNNKLKLPDRSEQVLFCKLTEKQQKMYQAYLDSPTVRDIKSGICQIFVGLTQLRKICNHPDIFDSSDCNNQIRQKEIAHMKKHLEFFSDDEQYGHYKKSGKMMVVDALLKLWKKQNHKVLLFTQSRKMLKIFMDYMQELDYKYLMLDGSTPIGVRQSLIDQFNSNVDIFVFLLTTRVGGVGVNLTGANRIIIYDPDWNPSTDIQARERAWRIGQQKHVIIYRLLTAGTIEEKIYHRQVFKLYLTNRILKDAKQKRFFKTNDLYELFTLGDNDKNIETRALFDDDLQINLDTIERAKKKDKKLKKKKKEKEARYGENDSHLLLSEEKLRKMRERAKLLSQMIAKQYGSNTDASSQPDTDLGKIGSSSSTQDQARPSSSRNVDLDDVSDKSKKKHSIIQRFDYLVKQDVYKPSEIGSEKDDLRYKRDDYILGRLFKNSNIFGALKHDKIETDSTADHKVVESEAEKVARDAIRALRESRRLCLGSSSGIPTWTGRNGQMASAPRLVPMNKSRSLQFTRPIQSTPQSQSNDNSLLASIKKRNQMNPVEIARSTFNVVDSDDEDRDRDFRGRAQESGTDDMASKLREFILYKSAQSGEAQTDEVLDFFNASFKPEKTAIFKAILYKLCDFHRRGDKGFWTIKSEFRNM